MGQQPFHHTITEDACGLYGKNLRELTWEQVCIVNAAINLGVMVAKRAERSKKQASGDAGGFLQRLGNSVSAWEMLDELELLDLIKELKAITQNDARWVIKEDLLTLARNVYKRNFIFSENKAKK